jgi:hypothetical protein
MAGSAVQIGDPITEKGLIELIEAARDHGLYTAITDCGAGGFSSAVGEMGRRWALMSIWRVRRSSIRAGAVGNLAFGGAGAHGAGRATGQSGRAENSLTLWDVEVSVLGIHGDGRLRRALCNRVVGELRWSFLHHGLAAAAHASPSISRLRRYFAEPGSITPNRRCRA